MQCLKCKCYFKNVEDFGYKRGSTLYRTCKKCRLNYVMTHKLKQRVVFDANDVSALVGLHKYRYDDIPTLVKK